MAPMIPMDAASFRVKPSERAIKSVPKIPNCPATPSRAIFGFSSNGPKSVMAPMAMKTNNGNNSVAIPAV